MRNSNPIILVTNQYITAALAATVLGFMPFATSDALAQALSIIEEITVTAQRREQTLTEVPSSVPALSGERRESRF